MLMLINDNRVAFALFHAVMRQASTAEIRYDISCLRAFVTGNVDDMYDSGLVWTSARRLTDSLCDNGSVFINTAGLRRLILRDDISRNAVKLRKNLLSVPCLNRNFS